MVLVVTDLGGRELRRHGPIDVLVFRELKRSCVLKPQAVPGLDQDSDC